MTDHAEALAKALEPPLTPLGPDDYSPAWMQIDALFFRHGFPSPPSVRLRDELVTMLAWARYGSALAAYRSRPAAEVVVKPLASRAALQTALETVVLSIAFYGRDKGTNRYDETMEQLCGMWVKADAAIRSALATPALAGTEPAGEVVEAWTRDDLAIGLAQLDGVTLRQLRSTVGDPQDANNWREYLGRADDLLAHLSLTHPDTHERLWCESCGEREQEVHAEHAGLCRGCATEQQEVTP